MTNPDWEKEYKERLVQLSKLQHLGDQGVREVVSDIFLKAYKAGEIPLSGERSFLENLQRLFGEKYNDLFGPCVWEGLKHTPRKRKSGKPPHPSGIKKLAKVLLKFLERAPSGEPLLGFSKKVEFKIIRDELASEVTYPGKNEKEREALVEDYLKKMYPRYFGTIKELLRGPRIRKKIRA